MISGQLFFVNYQEELCLPLSQNWKEPQRASTVREKGPVFAMVDIRASALTGVCPMFVTLTVEFLESCLQGLSF